MSSRMEFIYQMAKYSNASIHDCQRLMRLGATHNRIELELTNGYKTKDGNWDSERTNNAMAKRERIGTKLEKLCAELGLTVEYGALTIHVITADKREVYIP